jgi:hypothetical protein
MAPPQMGQSGIPLASTPAADVAPLAAEAGGVGLDVRGVFGALGALFAAGAATAARPSRGGQITPSQLRSLHLKSGALGLRLFSRLSHIGPWHFGQTGTGD